VNTPTTNPQLNPANDIFPKGSKSMLLYESLARERMREAEQVTQQHLVRRLNSARRWQRLSAWAARRANRAQELL
jgi:hypothetical protein